MLVKPSGSLSALYLKTQGVTAACPLISYLGKIPPLENTEYRFGGIFLRYFEGLERKLVTEMDYGTDRDCSPTGLFPGSASKHRGGAAERCG